MCPQSEQEHQIRILSADEAPEKVLDELSRLADPESSNDIRLLNFYKEVPICNEAKIRCFFDDTIVCQTGPAQARAIDLCRYSVLRSPHLSHDVYSTATYDQSRNEVVLSEFSYADVLTDNRSSLRVRLNIPVSVIIEAGPKQLIGRLRDISLCGCATEVVDRAVFAGYAVAFLNMELPLKRQKPLKLRVAGRLIRIEGTVKPFRCIFHFEHDRKSEDAISRFIAGRQSEIIQELRT